MRDFKGMKRQRGRNRGGGGKPGGVFAVEIGHDQAGPVSRLFLAAGADEVQVLKDLADRDRVVAGVKNPLGKPAATG